MSITTNCEPGVMDEGMSEDEGRQVPPHRSGGGQPVVVGGIGHRRLGLAPLLAFATGAIVASGGLNRPLSAFDDFGRQDPINTGRRKEKDAIALAKAQAKRDRRAAKRRATE